MNEPASEIGFVKSISLEELSIQLARLDFEFEVLGMFHAEGRYQCIYKVKRPKRVTKKKSSKGV